MGGTRVLEMGLEAGLEMGLFLHLLVVLRWGGGKVW